MADETTASPVEQATPAPSLHAGDRLASFKKQHSLSVRNTTSSEEAVEVTEPVVELLATPTVAEVEDLLEQDLQAMQKAGLLPNGHVEASGSQPENASSTAEQLEELNLQ